MRSFLLVCFLLTAVCAHFNSDSDYTHKRKMVCYFASWTAANGYFKASRLKASVCTHVMYAFIGAYPNATIQYDNDVDIVKGGFKHVNKLKNYNPKLKTLLSLGGGSADSALYSALVATRALRSKLVSNLLNFVKKYKFDGIDIDWEYPAQRGGVPADKANYALLLKELSMKFKPAGLLVTAALSAYIPYLETSYNIPALNSYLDLILLMTYDYHGTWDPVTGATAPLYAAPVDFDQTLNVNGSIVHWLESGVRASKLVMGIPLYGSSFTLADVNNNGVGAPKLGTPGGGNPGPDSQTSGILFYNEICRMIKSGGWTVVMHPQQKVPYAYKGNQWVGYDNVESVYIKAKYVKKHRLAGSMVWAVHNDDFLDHCGAGTFPLINMISKTQG